MVQGRKRTPGPTCSSANTIAWGHNPIHGRRVPCHHDLDGCVEVRRADDLIPCGLTAHLGDPFGVEPEDGRHGALADRYGLLHERAAGADRPYGVREVEGPGRDMGAVLAETVASGTIERHALRLQGFEGRDRNRQDGGLGRCGQGQLGLGSLEASR